MEKIAQKMTNAIQREKPGLTDLQLRTIKFGLECLLGELSKIMIYVIIFSVLSLAGQFLVGLIFFSTIRLVAGGYHENTYWRCFFTSLGTFSAIIGIGNYLPMDLNIRIFMLIAAAVLTWIYAPVDHPNKPIISIERRRKFKYYSLVVVVLMGGVGILLPDIYSGIAVTAILIEALSLPAGEFVKRRSSV